MFVERLRMINKIGLYLLIFTSFLGPAFLVFEFGSIHIFPFRVVWSLLIISTILYVFFRRSTVLNSLTYNKIYFIFPLLWLLYGSLSIIWAVENNDAIRQIIFLSIGISIIYFVAIYFDSLESLKYLQALWVFTFVIIVAVGLWNMLTGQHLISSVFASSKSHIPVSVFHYHNDLATYLALSCPFVLSYTRYSSRFLTKIISVLLLFVALVLLIATGSRANFIAVAVGGIFWFIFLADCKTRIKSLIITATMLTILIAFIFCSSSDLALAVKGSAHGGLEKLTGTLNILTGDQSDLGVSFGSRLNFFRNGLIYLCSSYGFGVGAGNAEYYIENYQYYDTFGYKNLHNWWLEIAVNYGIFIFLGFVYYYISLIINLYKIRCRLNQLNAKMICEALLLSLVIFFFAAMSTSSLFGYGFPWVLFAFAVGFVNIFRKEKGKDNNNCDKAY